MDKKKKAKHVLKAVNDVVGEQSEQKMEALLPAWNIGNPLTKAKLKKQLKKAAMEDGTTFNATDKDMCPHILLFAIDADNYEPEKWQGRLDEAGDFTFPTEEGYEIIEASFEELEDDDSSSEDEDDDDELSLIVVYRLAALEEVLEPLREKVAAAEAAFEKENAEAVEAADKDAEADAAAQAAIERQQQEEAEAAEAQAELEREEAEAEAARKQAEEDAAEEARLKAELEAEEARIAAEEAAKAAEEAAAAKKAREEEQKAAMKEIDWSKDVWAKLKFSCEKKTKVFELFGLCT